MGRTHCVFSVVLRHARCSSPRPSWTLAIVQPWQNKSHRKRQEIRRFDHVFCSIFRIYIYIYQSCRCTSQGDRNTSDTIWQQYNRTKKTPKESLVLCFFLTFVVPCFCNLVVTITLLSVYVENSCLKSPWPRLDGPPHLRQTASTSALVA